MRAHRVPYKVGTPNPEFANVSFSPDSDLPARPLFRRSWGKADISRRIRAVAIYEYAPLLLPSTGQISPVFPDRPALSR
jgi:hypothetical protein